jgi:hypothetical protein
MDGAMANLTFKQKVQQAGGSALPDNKSYVNRFEIKSETSDSVYVIAQSKSGGWWACECFGFRRHQHCKHLERLGLPGHHQPHLLVEKA